jgi:hypothetical protein
MKSVTFIGVDVSKATLGPFQAVSLTMVNIPDN